MQKPDDIFRKGMNKSSFCLLDPPTVYKFLKVERTSNENENEKAAAQITKAN